MKTTRVSKKSSARTKHQIEMERRRNSQCIDCGHGLAKLDTGVATILPVDGRCGQCRYLEMQKRD